MASRQRSMALAARRAFVNATRTALVVGLLMTSLACAGRSFLHEPADDSSFRERVQTQRASGLRVSAAVPSAEETRAIFGLDLYARDVQPVWIEVENRGADRVRFAPVSVDPQYYSALEIAYMHRSGLSKEGREQIGRFFYDAAMSRHIHAGEVKSGFVFTHLDPGTKAFNVDLFGPYDGEGSFTFFIEVPGRVPNHSEVSFEAIYPGRSIPNHDLASFRKALREVPCCTANADGSESGEPLNVVMVGEPEDAMRALLRAGWYERARLSSKLAQKKIPHLFGREPDAIFGLRRSRESERSELLIWLAPFRAEGKPVWVAATNHFMGNQVELLDAILEPRFDPDVDDSRDHMLQLMWYAQGLEKSGWQNTGRPVPIEEAASTFTGNVYFTDGLRVVLWLSGDPISQVETESVSWDAGPKR